MSRRIVITGIGSVTPLGMDTATFWTNIKNGKSGISLLENCDVSELGLPVKIGGEIKNFDLASYYEDPRKKRSAVKDMDRFSQFAVVAAEQAVVDSKLDKSKIDLTKAATFVGTGIGGIKTTSDDTMTLLTQGPKKVGIRSIIRLMPNAAAGQVAIEQGFQGRAKSDATACASGLDALMDAFMYMKAGFADTMIAGGTEACLNPLAIASFSNMTALSKRECEPTEASCPFDARRDGFVMGEGAVLFVLETLEQVKAQGREDQIYAELVGAGASCDAYHITAPSEDGSGGARAITAALESAGIADQRDKVDYIHAHGTSTPLNDARETLAIKKVFGDHAYKLCVSSTKSMTGHLIGAAGPCGMAVAAFACRDNVVAPTINYKEKDPVCDLDYVPNEAREREVNYALVQALGFGGHNTAVLLKKYQG